MPGPIAYIMSRFPNLSETFILREMIELENNGWRIALYPLINQQQPVIHAATRPWLARAHRLPYVSRRVLAANARQLARRPRLYASLWWQIVWENRTSLNLLARAVALLPKAVYAAQLMKDEGITHIHAHYATHPALVAWIIHRLTHISYSVTVHAHDIFVRRAMLATKLREASFVVAISEYNRELLGRALGPWVRSKTHVVHCGVMPDEYAPRRQTQLQPSERFEIVNIGSLQPYKGHGYLLQACARLRQRGIPLRCRIIGSGEERPALEKMVADMELTAEVQLLGPLPQEEVSRLLPTAHCYVQPSVVTASGKMEGIPVALMEALACALPVVATSISGIPELVLPGRTGQLVPPADAGALAESLAAVYNDYAAAARMGDAGRAWVLQQFDLRANVKQLAALFATVAGASD
ncbi:MAG: glycosyltransferase [Chloroflexi bacterium]|nr:glycosyltransferase [Chloroflexota bacterium]